MFMSLMLRSVQMFFCPRSSNFRSEKLFGCVSPGHGDFRVCVCVRGPIFLPEAGRRPLRSEATDPRLLDT